MTCCPDAEQMRKLLDDQLPPGERAAVDDHLESCPSCQAVLAGLTTDAQLELYLALGTVSHLERPSAIRTRIRTETLSLLGDTDPGSAPQPSTPEVPGYEILGKLGQGGMGVVYKARQRGLDRLVALKMIRGGAYAGPEHLARFEIEAWAVAQLRHPHVVQIHEVGDAAGQPYVALELLEGGSLEQRIAGTPLDANRAADLLVPLAEAVEAAHRAGVVHRDLKSANVLFSLDGVAKIADFGLAKRIDEPDGPTQSGQVMGSPSFMAPEQANGEARRVGPSADIYALGAILYQMLTGRPPFQGSSPMETLLQVIHDDPAPPSRLRSGLPRDLETICLKCLAKEPARRYATAAELAVDLRRFLAGTTIRARRTGAPARAARWARRRPAVATLAASIAVGAISVGIVAWSDYRARGVVAAEAGLLARIAAPHIQAGRLDDAKSAVDRLRELTPALRRDPGRADLLDEAVRIIRRHDALVIGRLRDEEVRSRRRRFHQKWTEVLFADAELGRSREDAARVGQLVGEALQAWEDEPAAPGAAPGPTRAQIRRHQLLWIEARASAQFLADSEQPSRTAASVLGLLDEADRICPPTRPIRELRATCLAAMGDPAGAERARAAGPGPGSAGEAARGHADWIDGLDAFHRRRWARAIDQFEAAARDDPDPFWPQYLAALCRGKLGRFDLARRDLTACLRAEPDRFWVLLHRGFVTAEQGAEIRAGRRPDHETGEAADRFADAAADYARAATLARTDGERYALLVNQSILSIRRGELDRADADLSRAVGLCPDRPEAILNQAEVRRRRGDYPGALAACDRALDAEPGQASVWSLRAELVESEAAARRGGTPGPADLAWVDRAIADQSRAIRLGEDVEAPRDRAANLARRGRLLALQGKHAEALADADAALALADDEPRAHLIRVEALLHLRRIDEVIRSCDAILGDRDAGRGPMRFAPATLADLTLIRGMAAEERHDYPAAIRDYTRVLTLRPRSAETLVRRGWAYLISDAGRLALLDFEAALRAEPNQADALTGRAQCRAAQGDIQGAVADAEAAARSGPASSRTAYNIARAFALVVGAVEARPRDAAGPARGPVTAQVVERYEDRAHEYLRQALDRLPVDRRAAFWNDVVQADPALAAIRRRARFSRTAGQLGRPAL